MKLGSINASLLSCQFYYTHEPCKQCTLWQRKKLWINIVISLLKLMRNISKLHFSGGGVLLNSISDVNCGTAERGADQNRLALDVRGGAVKRFHFAQIINEWPLNGRIVVTRVRIWSFWFAHCMYQSYFRLIIYRFQIYLLLLVYKLYSFLLFWIQ